MHHTEEQAEGRDVPDSTILDLADPGYRLKPFALLELYTAQLQSCWKTTRWDLQTVHVPADSRLQAKAPLLALHTHRTVRLVLGSKLNSWDVSPTAPVSADPRLQAKAPSAATHTGQWPPAPV